MGDVHLACPKAAASSRRVKQEMPDGMPITYHHHHITSPPSTTYASRTNNIKPILSPSSLNSALFPARGYISRVVVACAEE